MLTFFRRIRQRLLSEGGLTRYLIYAIGEIILVVIGILLALQINNANEAKKSNEKIRAILKDVHADLVENIEDADGVLEYHMRKDSILYEIMHDRVSKEDYLERRSLGFEIASLSSIGIRMDGYNNLSDDLEKVSSKYQKVVSDLKSLYGQRKEAVESGQDGIRRLVEKYIDWLVVNKSWGGSFYFEDKQVSPEELDYYLKSDFYKNSVANYWNFAISNYYFDLMAFRGEAQECREQIAELLDLEDGEPADYEEIAHWAGIYQNEEDSITISYKDDVLTYQYNSSSPSPIVSFDNNRFVARRSWFCYLELDENGKVVAVNERVGDRSEHYVRRD